MTELDLLRQEINTVDSELAGLFARRMKAAAGIAEYKRENGLPVFDAAREQAVRERAAASMADETLRPYYVEFVQAVMDVSKEYQSALLEEKK